MEEIEIWKDIEGYEGLYKISNFGKVKSLGRFRKAFSKKVYLPEKILKSSTYANYENIQLSKDSIRKGYNIHSLVAIAFLGHKPCGYINVIDHKDNDRRNNRASNLRIISNRKNTTRRIKDIGSTLTKRGKWKSSIFHNGKSIYLGTFSKKQEALDAYKNALNAIHNGSEIVVQNATTTSKHKGVSWCNTHKKWIAVINRNKVAYRIGAFKKEIDAFKAVEAKRIELDGC